MTLHPFQNRKNKIHSGNIKIKSLIYYTERQKYLIVQKLYIQQQNSVYI